ncbi:AraC family transcriptional regulator [Bradyrhizobium tropiciagri]|uniref:AraC family transcriptional regulator n=1 Tax=Bradyrhizobium tropiciagri TaxID=312253 RepID=UPI001BAABEA7|nr:AraC family transcriptional regulator [Bradyrhizobium tropiciagri]MBR0869545.1 AraC family transcriptional regulator [Bradyrhizobium tropiciagri]
MAESRRAEAAGPDPSIFRFTTADYAPADRLEAWREVYGKTLCKQDIEPMSRDRLDANVMFRRLPGLATMRGDLFQALYRRKPCQVESDRLFLTIGLAGSFEVEQLGRDALVRVGDGFVGTGAEPLVSQVSAGCRSLTLSMPARTIAPMVPGLDAMFGRSIPAASPPLRMLARYVGFLEESGELAIPQLQPTVVKHVHDLVVLALGASRDAAVVARLGGGRAARLREIKADIEQAIGRDEISIDRLSARHRLPVRYIQRLFEVDGVTFTEFVLARRLAWVHRMLTDRRFADLPISAIASEAGFSSQPYFNRSFRGRYGVSPSELRAGEGASGS